MSRCRACVAVAELFAAAAAGDTLRCCFLALLSCPPPLVLVLVMLLFFVLLYSSGESTATVTALQSGRSPHGGGQRHVPVLHSSCLCVLLLVLVFCFCLGSLFSLTCFVLVVDGSAIWAETAQDFAVTALQSGRSPHKISPSRGNHSALALCHGLHSQCAEF